jgi:hypothetical protein
MDGRPENQEPMFNPESIKAISNSLIPKIGAKIGGSLIAEVRQRQRQVFNLFDDAEMGDRAPVSGESSEYIPRMERVQFWKGFADEHDLHVDLDSFKRWQMGMMNERNKALNASLKSEKDALLKKRFERQLEDLALEATEFRTEIAQAEATWDEVASRHDYTAAFEALLYETLQDAIDKTREGIGANRYPFNELSDDEIRGMLVLIEDLEKQI